MDDSWVTLCLSLNASDGFNPSDCILDENELSLLDGPSSLGPVHIVTLLCYGLVVVLGVPGNALVVWVTAFRMPSSVSSLWFLQLSVADLLCCLSLPLLMVPLAQDQHWPFGALACKLLSGLLYFTMYCSVLLLVVISLDRWLLVSRPVWCQNFRRKHWARKMCVVVWVLAMLCSTPHFVFSGLQDSGLQKVTCGGLHTLTSAWLTTISRFLLGFLLPFVIILGSHLVVYGRATDRGPGMQLQKKSARSLRTRRVILAVVMGFVLCWLPLHVVDIVALIVGTHSPALALAHVLTLCLAYFNSCLNPLLYVCLGRSFKDSLNRSLRGVFNFMTEDNSQRASCSHTRSTNDNSKDISL